MKTDLKAAGNRGDERYDVLIIGAGAAGTACAIMLAQKGVRVAVSERDARACVKLAATGNGRCNLSNSAVSPARYNDPIFVAPALQAFGTAETAAFFASLGIPVREKDGRLYPYGNNSGCVVNAFVAAAERLGIRMTVSSEASGIERIRGGYRVRAATGGGEKEFFAANVVFACGSNATSGKDSLSLMTSLGYKRTACVPAIAPIPTALFKGVSGVRAIARGILTSGEEILADRRGEVLFRDDALSGMLAFELSSAYARALRAGRKDLSLALDFAPDISAAYAEKLISSAPACDIRGSLNGFVPRALAEKLAVIAGLRPSDPKEGRCSAVAAALRCTTALAGEAPQIKQAQVVCGGLEVSAFDPRTMMSLTDRGLYAIGEALDVDGECGGFNLQWAWSSAAACARSITENRS